MKQQARVRRVMVGNEDHRLDRPLPARPREHVRRPALRQHATQQMRAAVDVVGHQHCRGGSQEHTDASCSSSKHAGERSRAGSEPGRLPEAAHRSLVLEPGIETALPQHPRQRLRRLGLSLGGRASYDRGESLDVLAYPSAQHLAHSRSSQRATSAAARSGCTGGAPSSHPGRSAWPPRWRPSPR